MKARIDSREGRLLYSRHLGIIEPVFGNFHSRYLRRFTLRIRGKVDARWKLSLPWCTTYKSCKAKRHEASSKDGNGTVSFNKVMPPPRPTTKWSRQMIAFRSNNAALESITAFAHSSESAGGHFLQTR